MTGLPRISGREVVKAVVASAPGRAVGVLADRESSAVRMTASAASIRAINSQATLRADPVARKKSGTSSRRGPA